MSVRLFTFRLAKHGRFFLQSCWKREIQSNILEQNQNKNRNYRFAKPSANAGRTSNGANQNALKTGRNAASSVPSSGIFRVGQHTRKLFVDNILNRVTINYSEELRTQARNKLFYGDSAQFFALIGVSLASGAGVLTKEDELEGVCWEIRRSANRLQAAWNKDDVSETLDKNFSIDHLEIAAPIAKGCAAVVYAAALKSESHAAAAANNVRDINAETLSSMTQQREAYLQQPELMSPIQHMSRFVHNFGGSVDNLHVYNQSSAAAAFMVNQQTSDKRQQSIQETSDFSGISSGVQGLQNLDASNASINRYPLALKMMFNYDIQSNALAILRAMYKETVPARQRHMNEASEEWERLIQNQTMSLPAHPNIVCMYGFFCDEVRNFPGGHLLYPIAQPQRINPLGYGRNMSLYLLMKRYDYSLRALLDTHELSTRTKLLLLAQLLEAVVHINSHGIAHRDLKSDNILIEKNDDGSPPVLVLSDFGCCLADKVHGLQIPYNSYDIDKGGNAALMAPEIINKQAGPFAVLNYAKADLWACGAIAYEIFGQRNPFYSSTAGLAYAKGESTNSLRNSDYKYDELPAFSDECPMLVSQLIYNLLNPNPSKRLSPDIAANVLQLFLWAPSSWLKAGQQPHSPDILQWLLSLTTKIMCEGRNGTDSASAAHFGEQLSFQQGGRRTYVEYLLICSFLARARLRRIRDALNWIQNVV